MAVYAAVRDNRTRPSPVRHHCATAVGVVETPWTQCPKPEPVQYGLYLSRLRAARGLAYSQWMPNTSRSTGRGRPASAVSPSISASVLAAVKPVDNTPSPWCYSATQIAVTLPEWTVPLLLADGGYTYVDPDIAEMFGHLRWHRRRQDRDYVSTTIEGRNWYLHRLIMRPPFGMMVHHRDGCPLHCWRDNLEIVTPAQNAAARRRLRIVGKSSEYHGVSWSTRSKKWYATVTVNSKAYSAGYYDWEFDAALARDVLAARLHGKYASLNFPELPM